MSCNTFHLINHNDDSGCYAIQRGVDLGLPPDNNGYALFYSNADLTGWVPYGQIRNNYSAIATITIADFTFTTPTYGTFTLADGSTITGTKFLMQMNAVTTQALPLPPKPFNGDLATAKVGSDVWVYEVKLVSPTGKTGGVLPIIAPSFVQIVDDVLVLP